MSFFDRIKGKKKDKDAAVVTPPEDVRKATPPMPIENRIAALKRTGADVTIRLKRVGAGSDGGDLGRSFNIQEIDPPQFKTIMAEEFGGGSYEVYFNVGDEVLMLESDRSKRELYHIRIAGTPKKSKTGQDSRDRKSELAGLLSKDSWLAPIVTMLLGAATDLLSKILAAGGNQAGQNSLNEVTEALIKMKQLTGEPAVQDPISLVEGVMGILEKLQAQIRPPVTTGGGGFVESAMAGLAPSIVNYLTGQQAGGTPALAGTPQTVALAAGSAQGDTSSHTPETATRSQADPTSAGPSILSMNPVETIKTMVSRGVDPAQAAAYAVEAIDAYAKFSTGKDIPPAWTRLLEETEDAIEALYGFMPEIEQDQEYKRKFTEAAHQYVADFRAQQAAAEAEELNGASEDVKPEQAEVSEAVVPEPEPSEGDGKPRTAEGDDDPDQVRQEC